MPDLNISLRDFVLGSNLQARGVSAGHAVIANLLGVDFQHRNRITRALSGNKFREFALEENSISIQPPKLFEEKDKSIELDNIVQQIIPNDINERVAPTDMLNLRDSLKSPLDELAQNVFDHSGSSRALICALRTKFNATIAIGDRGAGLVPGFFARMGIESYQEAFRNGTSSSNSKLFAKCDQTGGEFLAFFLSSYPRFSSGKSGNRGFGLYQLKQVSANYCMFSNEFVYYRYNNKTGGRRAFPPAQGIKRKDIGLVSEYYIDLRVLPTRLSKANNTMRNMSQKPEIMRRNLDELKKLGLRDEILERLIGV